MLGCWVSPLFSMVIPNRSMGMQSVSIAPCRDLLPAMLVVYGYVRKSSAYLSSYTTNIILIYKYKQLQ